MPHSCGTPHGEGRPETPAEAAHFEAALPVERPGENGEPEDLNPIMTMWSPIWRTWLPTFESNFAWLMRIISTLQPLAGTSARTWTIGGATWSSSTCRRWLYYLDRQLALQQVEVQRDQQENQQEQIQMAVNQRINQLLNRNVYLTPRGECWHLSEACTRARSHSVVYGRRACLVCVHALQVPPAEPAPWLPHLWRWSHHNDLNLDPLWQEPNLVELGRWPSYEFNFLTFSFTLFFSPM